MINIIPVGACLMVLNAKVSKYSLLDPSQVKSINEEIQFSLLRKREHVLKSKYMKLAAAKTGRAKTCA